MDTQDTKESLQIQTDISLQICLCGFVCLKKASLVALAFFFRRKQNHPSSCSHGCFLEQSEMLCCTEVIGVFPPHFSGIEFHAQNLVLSTKQFSPPCIYIGQGEEEGFLGKSQEQHGI